MGSVPAIGTKVTLVTTLPRWDARTKRNSYVTTQLTGYVGSKAFRQGDTGLYVDLYSKPTAPRNQAGPYDYIGRFEVSSMSVAR